MQVVRPAPLLVPSTCTSFISFNIQKQKTKQIYIGFTENLKRRVDEHNRNETKATRRKSGKWIVVYTEIYKSKDDAGQREQRLKKHGRAKQELLKRIKNSLIWD